MYFSLLTLYPCSARFAVSVRTESTTDVVMVHGPHILSFLHADISEMLIRP